MAARRLLSLSHAFEFRDSLAAGCWSSLVANSSLRAANTVSACEDEFTADNSAEPSPTDQRCYRIRCYVP